MIKCKVRIWQIRGMAAAAAAAAAAGLTKSLELQYNQSGTGSEVRTVLQYHATVTCNYHYSK